MAAPEVRRPDAGPSLPVFERLGSPPPAGLVAERIEALTAPGDVVVDLHGRGGWVARAAIDRQRRALTIESSPLSRLLAELVLRPPDLRHLDAAFAAVGTAPRGDSSVRAWIADRWATRCPTCERSVTLDELVWERSASEPDGLAEPIRRTFRCSGCRDQRGGGELRHAPPDEADRDRARSPIDDEAADAVRPRLRERFPVLDADSPLADELLELHSARQLAGLAAILERVESDLRAAPVEAALRIAFLHAVLPASRLHAYPGRVGALRIANGRLRGGSAAAAGSGAWRERNPWLAFEDGYRLVRSFIQRLESAPLPPVQARYAPDLASLVGGSGTTVVRLGTPSTYRALGTEGEALAATGDRDRVRLVLAFAPPRPTSERLAIAYHATAWALGREAAQLLPLEALFGGSTRVPWSWQAGALRRSLAAADPILARDGRATVVVDAAAEAVVAAAAGAASARYRLGDIRPIRAREGGSAFADRAMIVELVPPGAALPPGPRTRANVPLDPVPGGAGDPELVAGRGLFAPPEPIDARRFSRPEAERLVVDAVVAALRTRGEPAGLETLLGEVLVALDRGGLLRRYVSDAGTNRPADVDQVEDLLALIRHELGRPTQRRLVEVAPGRWWLADRADREAAEAPLSDRVEWATYSLLSTAGPLSEHSFEDRVAALFRGADLPDDALVRACLESYRSRASTPDRLITNDDLAARTHEHAELLALLAETGHRIGLDVAIAAREQARRLGAKRLGEWLEPSERTAYLGGVVPGRPEALADIDVVWYARGRLAFLFEVEWTAMLGDVLLRRHVQIPADERVVRFLVVPPERTELVRAKLDASPLLRDAVTTQNWHVLKWNHVRTFAALEQPSLDGLEPFLGLDPVVERRGEQLGLFDAAADVPAAPTIPEPAEA